MKQKNLLIIVSVLILLELFFLDGFSPKPLNFFSGLSAPISKTYLNEKGEKWGPLPPGAEIFQVASAEETWPKFIEGKIDPVKVSPGDLQKFRIVVQSQSGIKSVIAEIETDNEKTSVPLNRTGTASAKDMMPPKYKIKDGTLNVLTEKQIGEEVAQELAKEKESLVNRAMAADGDKEIWEGEWRVKDTHVKTYHTAFVATDNNNRSNSLVLAWSDPCSGASDISGSGGTASLSTTCTIGSGVDDGIDNANLVISSGVSLSLITGVSGNETIFAWNPGRTITINPGGSITIGAFARLFQAYLFHRDADLDGYTQPTSPITYSSSLSLSGYARRWSSAENDCVDTNPEAWPGTHPSGAWYTTDRGDGSFDYECDGNIQLEEPTLSGLCAEAMISPEPLVKLKDFFLKKVFAQQYFGWAGTVPACGQTGFFNDSSVTCITGQPIRTQGCR